MVHEKYIKRNGKIFGPYLYENYREKGITKTRYLGLAKETKNKKNLQSNLPFKIIVALLLIIILSSVLLFFLDTASFKTEYDENGLASYSPLNIFKNLFIAGSPLNVLVSIQDDTLPKIYNLPSEIEVCENTEIVKSPPDYDFYIEDSNGVKDLLIMLNPIRPFYIDYQTSPFNAHISNVTLWSQKLTKKYVSSKRNLNNGWAVWKEELIITDNGEVVSQKLNITIIEVNNAPKFNIDVQTILPENLLYTEGDDRNFYYDLGEYLTNELEETPTRQLIFNLTYANGSVSPFRISSLGVINITGNQNLIPSGNVSATYHLNLSVIDTNLSSLRTTLHPNINKCYNSGGNEDAKAWSDDFYLTITRQNRVPVITSYYPLKLNLSIYGSDSLYFNLTARDPDYTPLDVEWYVDDVLKETDREIEEKNVSEFEYIFGCDISGEHRVIAVVTDGLENTSVQFNLSIGLIKCPSPSTGGGGGGGGGGKLFCEQKWGCEEWMQCQNLINLSGSGWASKETELSIKERCGVFNWSDETCGFQQRICEDFNHCNAITNRPGIIRECYYTENPTCNDGIKNCHDNLCEVLTDCGGPCNACPSCSDQIKNQDEEGIDCGGVCEQQCIENPLAPRILRSVIIYSLFLLLLLILLLVIKQTIKYFKAKKTFQTSSLRNKYIRGGEEFGDKSVLSSLFFVGFVIVLIFFANTYISNVSQTNFFTSDVPEIGGGIVANYGLMNGFMKNLGLFFASDIFVNSNSMLKLFDDTESYFPYTEKVERSGDLVKFYANYTQNVNPYLSITGVMCPGCCNIQFQDSEGDYHSDWRTMDYNYNSLLWEYEQVINYKGNFNYSILCNYDSAVNSGEDRFLIVNTAPEISVDRGRTYIDFDGDKTNTDYWSCIEDNLCVYDFSKNKTDPDANDVWDYFFETSNTTLTDYVLDSETGILQINVTHSKDTGTEATNNAKKIQLGVKDNEEDALIQWAKLWVDVQEVNDAPIFEDLKNKTLLVDESFKYELQATDEEENAPFVFNLSPNSLFDENDYSFNQETGVLSISFTPGVFDLGFYEINFTIMDYNPDFGNSTRIQSINFSVVSPIWIEPLEQTYSINEGERFYLNLSSNISGANGEVNFSHELSFSSFNITPEGVIEFIAKDSDVGNWQTEIIVENPEVASSKFFEFTILNENDSLAFSPHPIQVENAKVDGDLNVEAFENAPVKLILFIEDDDLAIPQKSFYDEKINLSVDIQGPNGPAPGFLNFSFEEVVQGNISMNIAEFIPITGTAGEYLVLINATDANEFSNASFNFTLKIVERKYTIPDITYPEDSMKFNLIENVTTNLTFRANHSVQTDDLIYEFYINGSLRDSFLGFGNDSDVIWSFTPNFTDETYGNETTLTLTVRNRDPNYYDLKKSKTWMVNITHSNAPVEFIVDKISNKTYPVNFAIQVDLKDYFLDIDHEDDQYNQNVSFDVASSDSSLFISEVTQDWIVLVSSSTVENVTLNITAFDLNMTNESLVLTNAVSNNFQINFEETDPTIVYVPVPTSGGSGGSSSSNIVALKLITPGRIVVNQSELIEVPLYLINTGTVTFNNIKLNSSAFKQGEEIKELNTSLDISYFKTLAPKKQENISLGIFFNTSKAGEYEVLVNVESQYPKYKDWAKIYIDLQPINESQVRDLLVFTEEFIIQNPQCAEITEIIKEARKFFDAGDSFNANLKTKEALDACKKAITQVSVPKLKIKYLDIGVYLILAIFVALFLGVVYYFIKRRNFQKMIMAPKMPEDTIKRF
ncbi:MAG: hypothetical protein WCX73_00495 [Candidatus Pacearchaeota archaeon]